ncbi:hypothetical protein [Acidocella facilis]|uniref:hypothetical protein n=1 Tax=Acidocella facilis TaxID=525 RepID=UPI001F2CA019|nr:hypothetical protein [Acidocella facilis]
MRKIGFALLLLSLFALAPRAHAAAFCAPGQTDAAARALPAALVPQSVKAFKLHGSPPAMVQKMTLMRCMDGKAYGCFIGANLPCGPANKATILPAAKPWCDKNPNAAFVPAYISGHDSLYRWRCRNGDPVHVGAPAALDAQGYFKAYWRRL